MDQETKQIMWSQFGAAIDTLERVVRACPDDVWFDDSVHHHQIWYWASHTLFWLDFYLSEDPSAYEPPEPFGLEELDPAGVMPPRAYTRDELLTYLEYGREKCHRTIREMTAERARRHFGKRPIGQGELLLYNMRHVQHHAAQLNLLLRQRVGQATAWVGQAGAGLEG
jgi:hypothetical protein